MGFNCRFTFQTHKILLSSSITCVSQLQHQLTCAPLALEACMIMFLFTDKNSAAVPRMAPLWNKHPSHCSVSGARNRCNCHMLFNAVLRGLVRYVPAILCLALASLSRALPRKPALLHLTIFPHEWRAERRQHGHLFQR